MTDEAFGDGGFAADANEVSRILVFRGSDTLGWGWIESANGKRGMGSGHEDFSNEAMNVWLAELRERSYSPGKGTWSTAEIGVYSDKPGELEVFDEEHLQTMPGGGWFPGGEPADADSWAEHLLAFPRTVDHIPLWMWDIFRSEGVTPPIYNPEFKSVDWKNRRRPVTDHGTDFSVEPTVIDPALEPGVLSRIGKKLFGTRS
ncbi:hypothetical protein ACIPWF_19025 [Paenarthrobacter sp. NPDC089989]|uniref:hypothetical protein n=1 Tax=unclassified Paenarthrobacter TaxID=2634190 RepID=UPI0038081925